MNGQFKKGHKPYRPTKKKRCKLCEREYLPNSFRQFYCDSCRTEKKKEWKKKYNNSEKKRISSRKYFHKEENRPKYRARWWVNHSLRTGKLKKPTGCENCQKITTKLNGHHFLGYDKENRLKIKWLCNKCHHDTHKRRFKSGSFDIVGLPPLVKLTCGGV